MYVSVSKVCEGATLTGVIVEIEETWMEGGWGEDGGWLGRRRWRVVGEEKLVYNLPI